MTLRAGIALLSVLLLAVITGADELDATGTVLVSVRHMILTIFLRKQLDIQPLLCMAMPCLLHSAKPPFPVTFAGNLRQRCEAATRPA